MTKKLTAKQKMAIRFQQDVKLTDEQRQRKLADQARVSEAIDAMWDNTDAWSEYMNEDKDEWYRRTHPEEID